jgi:hypothetical protein
MIVRRGKKEEKKEEKVEKKQETEKEEKLKTEEEEIQSVNDEILLNLGDFELKSENDKKIDTFKKFGYNQNFTFHITTEEILEKKKELEHVGDTTNFQIGDPLDDE